MTKYKALPGGGTFCDVPPQNVPSPGTIKINSKANHQLIRKLASSRVNYDVADIGCHDRNSIANRRDATRFRGLASNVVLLTHNRNYLIGSNIVRCNNRLGTIKTVADGGWRTFEAIFTEESTRDRSEGEKFKEPRETEGRRHSPLCPLDRRRRRRRRRRRVQPAPR